MTSHYEGGNFKTTNTASTWNKLHKTFEISGFKTCRNFFPWSGRFLSIFLQFNATTPYSLGVGHVQTPWFRDQSAARSNQLQHKRKNVHIPCSVLGSGKQMEKKKQNTWNMKDMKETETKMERARKTNGTHWWWTWLEGKVVLLIVPAPGQRNGKPIKEDKHKTRVPNPGNGWRQASETQELWYAKHYHMSTRPGKKIAETKQPPDRKQLPDHVYLHHPAPPSSDHEEKHKHNTKTSRLEVPGFQTASVPWFQNTLELWNLGPLEPWNIEPCNAATLQPLQNTKTLRVETSRFQVPDC